MAHPYNDLSRTPDRGKSRLPALLLLPAALLVAFGLVALRLHYQPPTVPLYVIDEPSPTGGDHAVVLARGGSFQLTMRPTGPVAGAVGARAFLVRGEEVRPWEAPYTVSRDGSIHLAGQVDTLFAGIPAGSWDLAVAVGRPENLPTAPRDVLRARDSTNPGNPAVWRLVRERIRVPDTPQRAL